MCTKCRPWKCIDIMEDFIEMWHLSYWKQTLRLVAIEVMGKKQHDQSLSSPNARSSTQQIPRGEKQRSSIVNVSSNKTEEDDDADNEEDKRTDLSQYTQQRTQSETMSRFSKKSLSMRGSAQNPAKIKDHLDQSPGGHLRHCSRGPPNHLHRDLWE